METVSLLHSNEFVVQISAKLQYLKSYNYNLFSFYPTNREPTHWKKILESIEIQDLTDRQPILVYKCPQTGKLFISDGQNRFLACKASKRPIYAIVVTGEPLKAGEASLSVLNSYQKNWSVDDYLEYYCAKGFCDYQRLKNIKDETGFSVSMVHRFWADGDNKKRIAKFHSGNLSFPPAAVNNTRIVKRCMDAIMKHKRSLVDLKSYSQLVRSVYAFLRAGAKSKEFVAQVAKNGHKIEDCGSYRNYFDLWNHIYNYRKREANKVTFRLDKHTAKDAKAILK